ncbi:MAG: formate dehydrogenase family accessory protein FdhD [Candidatus Riflebacteria bacterium HGW-Riflebacteria-2]|jgi:FdhD protein|nr:MAG: formate dehydrogenase family accessory protein FdhD [Candidatus Riflebacteria bacterium HGW-Riflebacteria-2]
MNAEPTLNTHKITVKRYEQESACDREEAVVAERSISLFVNGKESVRLMALPDQIEELAAGFLYSECVISHREDIVKISFNPTAMSVEIHLAEHIQPVFSDKIRSVTTGCGRGLTFVSALNSRFFSPISSQASIAPQTVIDLMRKLQRKSSLFHDTGGVHSAAVAENDEILFCSDDIGRHNAVDKVLGWLLRSDRLTPDAENNRMLLTTGRLSSEIVTKAVRGRFAFLISPSAPTSGAVQLAEELGITLIGFARGERFNIYTHPERVRI